jgi:DNA repair photolyase
MHAAAAQAFLPLPDLRPPTTAPASRYTGLPVRDVLSRPAGVRAPFAWTLNPYRGCEHGCVHCPARYTHGFLGLDRWREFETRIFVKHDAAAALARRLRRSALAGEPVALGTAADPYQPAEAGFGVTRSLLRALAAAEGMTLTLFTRSPLVVRDLHLLAELDQRHAITVVVGVVAADPALARRLEPGAADPAARLGAVARLAAEGIATEVACSPLLPGINADDRSLRALLAAAREAGAADVRAEALRLPPATRARFVPWLAAEFPRLVPLYRRLYGRRSDLRRAEANRLLAPFRRLRLQYGFPLAVSGRG